MEENGHTGGSFEQCAQSCCSGFINLQDPNVDAASQINLTNPVHALFAPEKFKVFCNGQFAPMPQKIYDKLLPVLRLVSRWLSDDRMVHFVYTMHDGSLHYGSSEWAPALTWLQIDAAEEPYDEAAKCPYPPQAQLTRRPPKTLPPPKDMRARSNEILENLAGVITAIPFFPDDIQETPGITSQIRSARPHGKLSETARMNFPRSMAIQLSFSASYGQIDHEQPSAWSQYRLARVILHEVGHALNNAIHGRRESEVFFQDSLTSESGFELEHALFGGPYEEWDLNKCTDYFSDPKPIVVMEHWPSPRTFNCYKRKACDFARRRQLDGFLTVSRITNKFIATTCTEEFWNARERHSRSNSMLNQNIIATQNMSSWVVCVTGEDVQLCDFGHPSLPTHVLKELKEIYERKQRGLATKTAPSLPTVGITTTFTTTVSSTGTRLVTEVTKVKTGKKASRLSPELASWKARRDEARKLMAKGLFHGGSK